MSKAKVYYIKLNEKNKIKELLPDFPGKIGFKCHFGEEGNDAFVPAELIKPIAMMAPQATFIETSVLYKSKRNTAQGHEKVARSHGFDFLPFDFLDGAEGDDDTAVTVNVPEGEKKCYLGKNLAKYDSLLVVSHFKGHIAAGFGGAIKNLSMGLASRRGKLDMHADIKHQVTPEECESCGTCIAHCPVNAISFNEQRKARIDQAICISCSKCISICPVSAIHIPWGNDKNSLTERLADYALAATRGKTCFYVNFLVNIVPECDCFNEPQRRLTGDIGILASSDPVAIDQASFDLVVKQYREFRNFDGTKQLARGEANGLGTMTYELINL